MLATILEPRQASGLEKRAASGLLNVEGAVRLAGLIRQDLAGLSVGAPLLAAAAPDRTTIASSTFSWGGEIIRRWNFLTGNDLIQADQGIYGTSVLLCHGALLSNGVPWADEVFASDSTTAQAATAAQSLSATGDAGLCMMPS